MTNYLEKIFYKYNETLIFGFYLVLVLFFLSPFLNNDYLFLLDMVFPKDIHLQAYFQTPLYQSNIIVFLIIKFFGVFLTPAIIQKIILFIILFSCSFSMYYFSRRFLPSGYYSFLSGLMYLCNPYVYERFTSGQWLVISGYAFFPFFVASLFEVCRNPTKKNIVKAILIYSLYPLINIHFAYIASFFLLLLIILSIKKIIQHKDLIKILKTSIFGISIFFLLNAYWLTPYYQGKSEISNFSFSDFQAFKTLPDTNFGMYINVLSLYGFWHDDFILPKDIFPFWWMFTIIQVILACFGIVSLLRKKTSFAKALILFVIISFFLSIWNQFAWSIKVIQFCIDHIFGFQGLRETAKLIGVISFFYSLCVPLGLFFLIEKREFFVKNLLLKKTLLFSFVILLFLSSCTFFFSYLGQIKTLPYPASWSKLQNIITIDPETAYTLILPWNRYMRFSFSQFRVIENPAYQYFYPKAIQKRTPDNIYLRKKEDVFDEKIERIFRKDLFSKNDKEFLEASKIKYILLLKCQEYKDYRYLERSDYLKKFVDNNDFTLYKIKN